MSVPMMSSTTSWWPFGDGRVAMLSAAAAGDGGRDAMTRPSDIAIATACLALVNLVVVCGNVFVLYILISQKSLHTSTNFIVLSLTLSDFLLGVLILPFSILQEYSLTWMFGDLWCKVWLALDVLFSTASIYNLLAISFDRYMAVKQPIKYRFISSNRMTKITIATVWLIASALALPPLIFDHFGITPTSTTRNYSVPSFITMTSSASAVGGQCTPVTSSDWYILFSAFVSFILPMFLMIALNFSIFYTVSDSSKLTKLPTSVSINGKNFKNFATTIAVSTDDVNSLLRIHRGGGRVYHNGLSKSDTLHCSQRSLSFLKKCSLANSEYHHNTVDTSSPSSRKPTFDAANGAARNGSLTGSLIGRGASIDSATASMISAAKSAAANLERADTFSVSLDSTTMPNGGDLPAALQQHKTPVANCAKLSWLNRIKAINMERRLIEAERSSYHSNSSSTYRCPSPPATATAGHSECESIPTPPTFRIPRYIKMEQASITSPSETTTRASLSVTSERAATATAQSVWYPTVVTTTVLASSNDGCAGCAAAAAANNNNGNSRKTTKQQMQLQQQQQSGGLLFYPMLHHHHQQHLRSGSVLRTEMRVARTIGVVVGCFTACWLPFTIIYVLQAYQTCPVGVCVPMWFFTVAFWLGYANSALNPLLYAAFSRDFRSAFRKVLMDRTSSFRSN